MPIGALIHIPTVNEDAVYTGTTTGIRTITASDLTVGSFNLTGGGGLFSIRNDTVTATDSTLTLGGPGNQGNGIAGTAGDLLYVTDGGALALRGDNPDGTGVLKIALGQSGNFNAGGPIVITSVRSGAGFGITKTGTGSLGLDGANSFTGGIIINSGAVIAGSATALGPAATATLTFGPGSTGSFRLNGNDTTVINLNTNATVGSPTIENNPLAAGTATLTDNTSGIDTFGGVLQDGAVGTLAFTKSGSGSLTLSGANTYTGATTVSAGSLLVNGSTASGSAVAVNGGTLGGSGTIQGSVAINSGATLAPGNSSGILNTGSVSFSSGSTFSVEIGGTTPGSGYDQLNVAGTVALNNATLNPASLGGFTPSPGQQFTIINNDSNEAISGTFAGLSQGQTIANFLGSLHTAQISYTGGDGNDVVITVLGANTISGTLLNSSGVPITDGRTIKLRQNGMLWAVTAITDGSGVYTFTGLSLTSGDRIAVYISGATEKGATITLSGTTDIINLNIQQSSLIVRTDNGGSIMNNQLRDAAGVTPDGDLLATNSVSPGFVLTIPAGFNLQVWSGTTFAPGADINAGGNWTNNGTFMPGTHTVTFNGTSNQTIGGISSTTFNNLTVTNTGTNPNNVVSLDGSLGATDTVAAFLSITAGVFDQGVDSSSSNLTLNGTGDVASVQSGCTWQWYGHGTIFLWGDVSNNGAIIFNSHASDCGDADDILIRSSFIAVQRTWKGSGTFSMTDVDVRDQSVPIGPALPLQILVSSGTDTGNNNGWIFSNSCSGPYTWIGGTNQEWSEPSNWSPVRASAGNLSTTDVLNFDGTVTPAPLVRNVPTQTVAAMRLNNGVSVQMGPNFAVSTLTMSGNTGTDLDIPSGTTLTLAGSGGLSIKLEGAGHECTVAGGLIFQDSGHRLTGQDVGAITFAGPNGSFTAASGFSGNPFGSGTNGSVIFQSGSTGNFNDGNDPFGGVFPAVTVFNPGSTAKFGKDNAFSSSGRTYGNLILDGNQSYSGSGSDQITVLNDFTLAAGSTLTLSILPGGDFNLFGNFDVENSTTGAFDSNHRTIKFQGGSNTQTIANAGPVPITFFDVLINETAGGKIQLLNPANIDGQLNLNTADSLLELNGRTLELNGTVTGPGNLKGSASSKVHIGGIGSLGTLNFLSGFGTLSELKMDRVLPSGSVTLGNDLLVDDSLLLTNGVVNMGAFTLAINGTVNRNDGYIIGDEQRSFMCSGLGPCPISFDVGTANAYSPVTEVVNVTGLPGTYTQTVKAIEGQHPGIPGANALQRYWTINKPTGPDPAPSCDITFHYKDGLFPGGDIVGTESNYRIFRYDGSFTLVPNQSIDTGANTATATGVTTFSDWTLAEPGAVCGAITLDPPALPNSFVGAGYSQTITAAGGTSPYSFATADVLPPGLTLSSDGILSGIPTTAGTYTFTITATDSTGCTGSRQYSVTIFACPSVFTVDTLDDTSDTNAATTPDGICLDANNHCSLRAAIEEANADSSCGTITINATAVAGQIDLTSALPPIVHSVNINGPGAAVLNVRRPTGAADFRIFTINNTFTVQISGLTISNGRTSNNVQDLGGGIFNAGTLSLTDCIVLGNSTGGGQQDLGGGIYNAGTLTITGCTVSLNNTNGAGDDDGGGIYNFSGTLTINNSTLSGNVTSGGNDDAGAGLYIRTGTVTIMNSTLSGNQATGGGGDEGGAIFNSGGALTLINSTIANNEARDGGHDLGGGIFNGASATTNLITCTISGNSVTGSGDDRGGGIFNAGPADSVTSRNTIISGNLATTGSDVFGIFTSQGHNLIGNTTGATVTPQPGDLFDGAASPLNLGALASNGGPTQTMALATGSVAIDAGDNCVFDNSCSPALGFAITTDQRGAGFDRKIDGDANGTAIVDIGALEVSTCATPPATPTASNGGPYCEGQTIQLSTPTVSGATYSWTGPDGFTSSDQNPTRANATTADAGTYFVTITVNGCTSAAGSTTVVVNPTPATPTASNGGPYCEGQTIQLSTPTVSGATYAWTGPNGFTSNAQNPTRANATTADSGTYFVTITVNGCTSAPGSTTVVVNPTPATPTASNGGPYCEGATIQLSTPFGSGATYSWTGPNGFTSSAQNPTKSNATTADAGTYFVAITVNGCTSAAGSTTVVVNPTPATPTATNGGPYCEGQTIQLSTPTVSGATYSWTGPNGFTSALQNPTRANATTPDAGTYSVTVTVNGCTSAAGTTNVVVNPTPATPTASNGGPYCEGATIQLSTPTVSGATYSWTGPNGFTSSAQNPTRANATAADAGTYFVTITVNGCTSAAGSTTVVVNPTPATPTASNGGPYCEGATIQLSTPTVSGATYSWTGPNGFTSSAQNPTRTNATTADAGTYFVTITVNGCTSAAGSTTVVVNPTPATPTASNGGPYCEGATIQLSTPTVSGATYSWTGPNGFTSALQNPTRANATTADAGTYSVTVTVNGCTSAAGTTNVVVNPTPATPTASNGGPYSEGQTIQLSTPTVSGATYSWTGPNGFTSTLQNPTRDNATTADAGTYSVTITVNGCTSAAGTTNVIMVSVQVQFAQANTNDTETNAGSHMVNIIVSRSGSAIGAVDVTYNITDGTATIADSDYSVAQATGTLHWNDGDGTDKNIAITVIGDTKYEPDEIVNLSLSSPSGATLGSQATATLTIVNDDSPAISGHIDYCLTPSANVPNTTINVTGSQTTSTITDASGNYSIALPQGGSYTLTPSTTALSPGAAGIDTADVIAVQRQFLGMTSLSGCALTAADATQDSTVDTADVLAIQQFFLSMSSGTAHVGEWQFNPANQSYANLSADQASQNFDAVVFGDVSGDLTPPPLANPEGTGATTANQIKPALVASVSLPVANIGVNQTDVTLAVTTTNIDPADNLVGFQGDFTFDSSVVTFQASPASPAGLTATNWNVSSNILGAGTIKTLRISAFSTTSTPLSGPGTLFNLNFTRVTNTVGANTPLIWAQSPNNFVFIDTNLAKPAPGSTPDGSITIVGPTAANARVTGQILDGNGNAIEGAAIRMSGTQNRLTITDAAGNYFFDNVETNGLYVISPSRANFSFSPAQRTFSQLGAQTEGTFTGAANNSGANPLDTTEYFVRQQYLDFLGREPDESGFNFWVTNIESCGADRGCREVKRIDTSAAFFLSIEFQQTGYLVYRTYEAAYGNLAGAPVPLKLDEFAPDTRQIGDGVVVLQAGWPQKLENNKRTFMTGFVQRLRFTTAYPGSLTPVQFVDRLFANARIDSTDPDYAASVSEFGTATDTADAAARARVLRRVAENPTLTRLQFNQAFVLMEYFGYLRRDPNSGRDADFSGYNFWLDKLNEFNGNFENAEMVKAFLSSFEYRGRFPR